MLDIKLIETQKEFVCSNLKKQGFDISNIDKALDINKKRKDLINIVEESKAKINSLSKEVGLLKREGKPAESLMKEVSDIKNKMADQDQELSKINEELHNVLSEMPNIISDSVPVGSDEDANVEIKKWGTPKEYDFKVLDHATLGENLGMLDFEAASKLTGSRFVVYKGLLARLERALANYMIDFHVAKGYQEILPPYIVNANTMYGTGQLPKFKDDSFKIEGRDWYLIPTAEVPVTNLKKDQVFPASELPLSYVSYTPCFRSEAGSYGRDTRGLIRMHQFNKVEMVNITTKEDSEKTHKKMVESACEILEQLGLPYRAVNLCTGDIGFSARETVDLEVWLPSQEKYREISSISNCWDFQSRRAKIRYKADKKPEFAHTLNGSGLAVGRTLVAILENNQNADGSITIPEVIQGYMGGVKIIKAL